MKNFEQEKEKFMKAVKIAMKNLDWDSGQCIYRGESVRSTTFAEPELDEFIENIFVTLYQK